MMSRTRQVVFDSGSAFERISSEMFRSTFNTDNGDVDKTPEDNMDGRSDDKGPEVESLALGHQCGQTMAFVGCERTSQIFVYDISDPTNVVFQSAIDVIGDTKASPLANYDAMDPTKKEDRTMAHLGTWDPEAISYDQEHNLLVVSGSVSGTVAVFEVSGWNCEVRTGFLPKVELKLMENMKIPSDYTNDHMFSTNASHLDYEWDKGAAEKSAFLDKFVVVVGETKFVQVIDMAKYKTMQSTITDAKYIDAPGTDAATCKSADGEKLVAVATEGLASKQDPGRVLIFTLSDMGKLTFISEISTIGALPDSIH
ncbi:hypothetical protein T484DRAFT_3368508 [Baffinella frigidus]|nr:hypothetical protein T484DRAFT_3368508 [Cryptophyta sp. CCMP2293]